jgi:hypothetical protein
VRVLAADGQPLYGDAVAHRGPQRAADLQHIYEKLGVSERAAAVAEAMRRGLLE